jgi:ketosteroid isomerase-like protein
MSGIDRESVVDDLLGWFVTCLRDRDVDGATRLFEDDAVLFGSEHGESAVGRAGLRAFFERLFERPHPYG